jgi:hypothetical protein
VHTADDPAQFAEHGWVRVHGAFTAEDASAMRTVTWRTLEQIGIRRGDPSTWNRERPDHLQHLKSDPAFRAVGSERTRAAIDEVLDGREWAEPKDWGAFFLVFPTPGRPWGVPTGGWHLDAAYDGPLSPPDGVKVHAMYGDVAPRAGGMNIISGSHRLVHRWFSEHHVERGTRAAKMRKHLHQHPYLRDLCAEGDREARIERFHRRVEEVDGIPLQVIENTADAGDVILMHPLLLHAPPAAHTGSAPRFLLNKDLRADC